MGLTEYIQKARLHVYTLKVNVNQAQSIFQSKFGNPNFNWWGVMAWTSLKLGKFLLLSSIWPWRSMSIAHKIIWILTKVSYTSDPNFVILAWMGEKLSHRQARDCRTHTHRRRQRQYPGLALLTLSWDKNWDSHSPMNGYPSFYPRIALVAPSPGGQNWPWVTITGYIIYILLLFFMSNCLISALIPSLLL